MGKALPEELNEPPAVLHVGAEDKARVMEKVRRSQRNDQELAQLTDYLEDESLPVEPSDVKRIVIQAQKNFYIADGVLYYENADGSGRRLEVLMENHEALFVGHFAPKKMFNKLSQYYYWPGMQADIQKVCENCIVRVSTQGQELRRKPPLHCIATSWATI